MLHWQIEQNIIRMLGKVRNWVIYIHLILPVAKILPLCSANSSWLYGSNLKVCCDWFFIGGLQIQRGGTQKWCLLVPHSGVQWWWGGFVCLILLGIFSSNETGFEESRGTEYSGLWERLGLLSDSHLSTCKLIASLLVEGTSVAEGLFVVLYVTLGRRYLLVMWSPVGRLMLLLVHLLFGSGNCFLRHLLAGKIPQELTPW